MPRFARTAILALTALVPAAAFAAPSPMATHAVFHVAKPFKGRSAFKHAMASATLRYTKGDVVIKVTADGLPRVSTLGKHAYVVYAGDGAMNDRVGALKVHGNMAGVKGEVMMTKVQEIFIYAEKSAADKHPHGALVLSAMVG